MAPHAYLTVNASLTSDLYHLSPFFTPSQSSSSETIINVVFGVCAVAIGMISIWQSHKAWKIWHANYDDSATAQNHGMQCTSRIEQLSWTLIISGDRVTSAPAEQAQLPSEPALPYTATSQLSPKVGELPYSSRNPYISKTLPGSSNALPTMFPPASASSVESPSETASHSKAVTEVDFSPAMFPTSGGPPGKRFAQITWAMPTQGLTS